MRKSKRFVLWLGKGGLGVVVVMVVVVVVVVVVVGDQRWDGIGWLLEGGVEWCGLWASVE
jgi:hypothetical protein